MEDLAQLKTVQLYKRKFPFQLNRDNNTRFWEVCSESEYRKILFYKSIRSLIDA